MEVNQFAVYQLKNVPENRRIRFRSYHTLQENGIQVCYKDYEQVYIGRMRPEEGPGQIRERFDKKLPQTFQGHSISVSDVLVLNKDGIVSSYYVEKSGVIAISGFIQRESSDARVSLNTTGFHIEGKEGRWLAFDSIIVDGRQFFLMEHETYRKDGAWTVVDEEGKLIVDHVCHGFDKPVQRQIKEYLDSPQLAEESAQQKIQKSRKSVLKKLRQKQAEIAKRNRKPEQKMAIAEDREYRRK